ncbi:MAG: UMP kinase [Candidatus Nealsonbacteria bacterium]|nr:UMP kinase [Candidatus Nealsonbacteria bacterium]
MKKMKIVVISLGGSIIVPGEIQIKFLKAFKEFILRFLKKDYKFIVVTGGGSVARNYINAASKFSKIPDEDKDWLGIHATRINAHLLRTIFKKEAYPVVLDNPLKKIDGKQYKLFIASGWRPGWSTDYCAVLIADRFKADKVINASNIDYVYDKDISKYKDANPIKEITWNKYRKLIGTKWKPGMKSPIDPIAAKMASKLKMTMVVVKGTDLKNLENALLDKKFTGTVIHP